MSADTRPRKIKNLERAGYGAGCLAMVLTETRNVPGWIFFLCVIVCVVCLFSARSDP